MSRLRALILPLAGIAAGIAAGLLLLAPPAGAHATVVGSDPADGGRLAASPATVTIRFDESVGINPGYLRVVDSSGRRVDAGSVSHPGADDSSITVPLRSGLPDGSYLASYRVTSADSHPIAGTVRWVVGNGALSTGGGPSGTTPVNQAVSSLLDTSHWLSFAGVGLVGGSWLIFWLWPSGRELPGVRRLVWAGWAAAVLGAVGEFLLQGPYAAGSGLSAVGHTDLLDATLHANSGQLLSVRLVLLGVLGAVLTALFGSVRRPGWVPESAAIAGAGIVVTFAASGHAQAADPRWLAVLVDALHLSAMIIWLGGLAMLLVAAGGRRARPGGGDAGDEAVTTELAAGVLVFSRVALACVATLAITGTIQAWREIGSTAAITTTQYGKLVLVKVALFAVLVGLGYLARQAVAAVSVRSIVLRLRRTVVIELLVGALVLAATGVLIAQPPGNVALAASRAQPRSVTVAVTGSSHAVVGISPGVHGTVQVSVQVSGARPTKLTVTASLPDRQLGPIPVPLQAGAQPVVARTAAVSSYSGSVLLPAAGVWQLQLTVQTSEFDSNTAIAKLRVY